MIEAIFALLGELLLQILGETMVELGLHSMGESFRRQPKPWIAALGYLLFGAILGGLSLLLFPNNLVPPAWRVANLVLTPIIAGALMAAIGAWRARHGQTMLRIDRFAYGYLFALSLALVRFAFAH